MNPDEMIKSFIKLKMKDDNTHSPQLRNEMEINCVGEEFIGKLYPTINQISKRYCEETNFEESEYYFYGEVLERYIKLLFESLFTEYSGPIIKTNALAFIISFIFVISINRTKGKFLGMSVGFIREECIFEDFRKGNLFDAFNFIAHHFMQSDTAFLSKVYEIMKSYFTL